MTSSPTSKSNPKLSVMSAGTPLIAGGAATGVGSLPLRDPVEAAEFVLRHLPDLPAIPSLPSRSGAEMMIAQAVVGIRGVSIDTDGAIAVDRTRVDPRADVVADLDHDAFGGLRAFLDLARGRTGPVKWQFAGPITLGLGLMRAGLAPEPSFGIAVRAVRAHVRAIYDAVAEAMPSAGQVVLLDEPTIGAMSTSAFALAPETAIDLVSGSLASLERSAIVGVHCCGDADWPAVLAAGPGIISLPVAPGVVRFSGYLARFLERGGLIAWGVVPTDRPVGDNPDRYWRELTKLWCDLVGVGCDAIALRRQAIVTPVCGLAHHEISQAEMVLRHVNVIAERVASQAVATQLSLGA